MKKGQISIEFLFGIGIIFFIFLALWTFTLVTQDRSLRLDTSLRIKTECTKLANLITYTFLTNTAHTASSAYPFTIVNTSRVIIMDTVSCSLPLNALTGGNFSQGTLHLHSIASYVEVTQ